MEVQPGNLWLVGGHQPGDNYVQTDATALLSMPEGMREGPVMPYPAYGVCALSINDTHSFIAGGVNEVDGHDYISTSFIYDWARATWTTLASMNAARELCAGCGVVVNPYTGSREIVVFSGYGAPAISTEIYDIDEDSWRGGPDYPENAQMVAAVQDSLGSFYALGGYLAGTDDTRLDSIYRFDEDTYEFVLLEQRLPYAAGDIMGLMVSRDMV